MFLRLHTKNARLNIFEITPLSINANMKKIELGKKIGVGWNYYLNFLCNTLFYWLKNWDDFVAPEKICLWRICSNVTENSSAIEYSAEINSETQRFITLYLCF
jgi:hypothetical protein